MKIDSNQREWLGIGVDCKIVPAQLGAVVMSPKSALTKSPPSGFNFTEINKFGLKQADALIAMQRDLTSLVEEANRNWLARAELERDLASDLATKLSTAKTPPDAAKMYQEWMSRRIQTLAEDGRKLFADSQKYLNAATRRLSNGGQKPEKPE
jgi:phasin protein